MVSILLEKRGRKKSGFQLLRRKWRFVWFTYQLLRAKYERQETLDLLMAMIERDSCSQFDSGGLAVYYSPSAKEVRGNDVSKPDAIFITVENKEAWRTDIETNIERLNKNLENKGGLSQEEQAWYDDSLKLFAKHYFKMQAGGDFIMDGEYLAEAKRLGWDSGLSTITSIREAQNPQNSIV